MQSHEFYFDSVLSKKIESKASELYLRDHHPYELAKLIFDVVIQHCNAFTETYRRQLGFYQNFFELWDDFRFVQGDPRFREAKHQVTCVVMQSDVLSDSVKQQLIETLSDPHELIDRLVFFYRAITGNSAEFIATGVLQEDIKVKTDKSASKSGSHV